MIGKINEFYTIGPVNCELCLTRKDTGKQIQINMKSEDTHWYYGGYINFSKTFSPADAEVLSSWREGESVNISWNFRGYAILNQPSSGALFFQDTTQAANNPPTIASPDFIKKILQPLGMSNRMIVEIPVETPRLLDIVAPLPTGIGSLKDSLKLLISHLQNALERSRTASTATDFRSVIIEIRAPLDSIKTFTDYQQLGKELFVDTGIIRDVDHEAAKEAAAEIIRDIWDSFKSLHSIASKPMHTTTKTGKRFSISPERIDAGFALLDALSKAKYLNERIEVALTRK